MELPQPLTLQSDFSQQITLLKARQSQFESQEKFLEADSVLRQIGQLTAEAKIASERHLQAQQQHEKLELESAHDFEFAEFRAQWEGRLVEYRTAAARLEEELRVRQSVQVESLVQQYAAALPTLPKPSAQLLSARKTKESLIKAKQYKEAHATNLKIANLEQIDAERFLTTTQEKIEQARRQIASKQAIEADALHLKHELGFKDLLRQRELELERLSKRFKNTSSALANLHGMVKTRSESRVTKLSLAPKRIERILQSAKSAATSPLQSPKSKSGAGSRGFSPKLGDGYETRGDSR